MPIAVLEKWAEGGSFNPECMAKGDYSRTTTILILLNPKHRGYSTGKHKHRAYCSIDAWDQWGTSTPLWSSSSMLIPWWKWNGNPPIPCVGQSAQLLVTMADTWPSPQTLHSVWLIPCLLFTRMIPPHMTFRSQQNHPVSFTADGLLVHQLLVWDCPQCEYVMDRHHGCTFSFLGECIFYLTSFHRSLFLTITWLHTMIPRQERMLHLSPLAPSQVRTHCSMVQPVIWSCTQSKRLLLSEMPEFSNPQTPVSPLLNYHHSPPWGEFYPPPPWIPNCIFQSSKVELDSSTRKWDYKSAPKNHGCPASALLLEVARRLG